MEESDDFQLDLNTFAEYAAMTYLIDGVALKKLHDIYALVKTNGKKKENGYVCIAEFGWMMKTWISLTNNYKGPYEKFERNIDFQSPDKYAVYYTDPEGKTRKAKVRTAVLAAWKAKFTRNILLGNEIYIGQENLGDYWFHDLNLFF